jgi:hypothetical protein
MASPQPIVVQSTKNVGVAVLLSILFGPLGMLYSTIPGAIIMLLIHLAIFVFTLGFGTFLFIFTWPLCVIWAAIAANSYNQKLIASAQRKVLSN